MNLPISEQTKAYLVEGTFKTGKTSALVDDVASCLQQGTRPSEVLVVAATQDACRALERRIVAQCGGSVRVVTAIDLALEVLGTPGAIHATGRKPRLLTRYETSFLMEDMKTSGVRPKRINELVRFFSRSVSELKDFDKEWLIYKEEVDTYQLLMSLLQAYSAYMKPEVSNRALRYLLDQPDARPALQVPFVFVDDAQCLSRASQYLAYAMAGRQLHVYANSDAAVRTEEAYPYAAGIDELKNSGILSGAKTLTTSMLSAGTLAALTSLDSLVAGDRGEGWRGNVAGASARDTESGSSFEVIRAEDPAQECRKVVAWVRRQVDSGIPAGRIAVTVPNKTWERNMARAIQAAGIDAVRASERGDVGGDIRYFDLSEAAQVLTLVALAADPDDGPALRAWCGFGDYLNVREIFSDIFRMVPERGSLAQVIRQVAAEHTNGVLAQDDAVTFKSEAEKIVRALKRLDEGLDAVEGKTGRSLAEAASEFITGQKSVPHAIEHLFDGVQPGDDARTVWDTVRHQMCDPVLPDADAVAVVPMQRLVGSDVEAVVLTGMVSGFTPRHAYFDRTKTSPEQAARMLARDAERTMEAMAQGVTTCAMSTFDTMTGADAEAHDVRVDRFFAQDGKRYAKVHQSLLLDAIEDIPIPDVW